MLAIPQLDVTTYASQVFWLVLCMSVLYFFIRGFYLPKMQETLEKRASYVKKSATEAESAEDLASGLHSKQEMQVDHAQHEAAVIINGALHAAEEKKALERKKAAEHRNVMLAMAESNVTELTSAQSTEIKRYVAEVARQLYKKTAGNHPNISDPDMLRLVNDICKRRGLPWA